MHAPRPKSSFCGIVAGLALSLGACSLADESPETTNGGSGSTPMAGTASGGSATGLAGSTQALKSFSGTSRRASSRMRVQASLSDSCMLFVVEMPVGMLLGQAKLRRRCGKVNLELRGWISLALRAQLENEIRHAADLSPSQSQAPQPARVPHPDGRSVGSRGLVAPT